MLFKKSVLFDNKSVSSSKEDSKTTNRWSYVVSVGLCFKDKGFDRKLKCQIFLQAQNHQSDQFELRYW